MHLLRISLLGLVSLNIWACQSMPVPTPRYIPEVILGEPVQLHVAAYRLVCNSPKPMQCLQITTQSGQILSVPYDTIEGFELQAGYNYRIIAQPKIDKNTNEPLGFVVERVLDQSLAQP